MAAKGLLIDTTLLIDHFRKTDKLNTVFSKLLKISNLSISTITAFEFLVGFKGDIQKYAKNLIAELEILPFDYNSAVKSAEIYQLLKSKNKLIEANDIFIASIAITNKLPLASFNKSHFERIEGLKLAEI